jgi:polysaccharide biosynthesis/export protein
MTSNYKNIHLAVLAIIMSISLTSQEINQDFINSLPQNLKSDVLDQISKNISVNPKDEIRYSTFNTQITPDLTKEAYKNVILEDFSNIKDFGYSFFQSFPSTFMPINDPSADSSYILDVDDTISIQVIRGDMPSKDIVIDRDGAIYLPEIGRINLAGVSLSNANLLINAKAKQYLIDTKVILTLESVRDIQILVTGEVHYPGVYTLGGYSNVIHAIGSSGGIKSSGSFRNIEVKRNGKIISTIDLYDLFVNADTSGISSLRTGDSILIPSSNNKVRVVGAINRPAIYEFKDGESAQDIISFAGGPSNQSNDGLFLISRHIKNSNDKKIISSEGSQKELMLLKKDRIFLPYSTYRSGDLYVDSKNTFITKPIKITGGVKYPGEYFLKRDETLSKLIKRAGGYTQDAYPFGGVLSNAEALNLEIEYNSRLYNEAIKSLATLATSFSNNINVASLLPLLEEFKNIKPVGRVQAEFDLFRLEIDPLKDTLLSNGDEIHIPFKSNVVHVFGEVLNPGSKSYIPGQTVRDYINSSGGLNKSADRDSIILVHANGDAERIRLNKSVFGKSNPDLYPGSVIYITRDLSDVGSLKVFSTISPIISSMAISLASLNSINRN